MTLDHKAGAWKLFGRTLESGWKVIEPIGWDATTGNSLDTYDGTGGAFSVPYIVEKNGRRAFLKAIDFSRAMTTAKVLEALHEITEAHTFETRILEICKAERMSRVVLAIDSGEIRVSKNLQDTVPYLIFELAKGDVRRRIQDVHDRHRLTWWLKAMHHATLGLSQLHSRAITHQDLKPSNLLSFGDTEGFKIGDLGRATHEGTPAPHEDVLFPGDWTYAPPELSYGHVDPNITRRRFCSDLYMLGSMICFFVIGVGSTALLMRRLTTEQKPLSYQGDWRGDYVEILPALQHAFTNVLDDLRDELHANGLPPTQNDKLIAAASQLCNPDPSLRGHPLDRRDRHNQLSLRRYVSLFDLLAKQASVNGRHAADR